MTKLHFLLLPFILLLSCSKNQNLPNNNTCNNIVETELYYEPLNEYQHLDNLIYDDKGRIIEIEKTGESHAVYKYYTDSIVLKATDIFGTDVSRVYYLDSKQRVIRTNLFDFNYTYNNEGYLISFNQPYTFNGEISGYNKYNLTYENGNLTEINSDTRSVEPEHITMQYYTEANQILMGYNSPLYNGRVIRDKYSFFLIQSGFYGKESANLIKSIDTHDLYTTTENNYIKDSKGRVTEISVKYKFSYECN